MIIKIFIYLIKRNRKILEKSIKNKVLQEKGYKSRLRKEKVLVFFTTIELDIFTRVV